MWSDSSRRAMHKHTTVSHFTVLHGQGNALSTACSGGEFRATGGVKKGGILDYLWTLKTWVLADSIRRVIRGHSVGFRFVPPALLGNSPRGGADYLWTLETWWHMAGWEDHGRGLT